MTVAAATDLSERSRPSLRSAARLASRAGNELVVFYCDEASAPDASWRKFVETPWEEPEKLRQRATEKLQTFVEETLADGPELERIELRVFLDQVEDAVEQLVDEADPALLVAGATGASRLQRAFFGSTAEEIVRTSDVPVLVVPHDGELETIEAILAPVDTSECSRESLGLAVDLALDHRAHLHVLRALSIPAHTVSPYEVDPPAVDLDAYRHSAREEIESLLGEYSPNGLEYSLSFPVSPPHVAIEEAAATRDVDLIVMGTHGRRGFERLFLGSTTSKVLREMPTPVLVVRERG